MMPSRKSNPKALEPAASSKRDGTILQRIDCVVARAINHDWTSAAETEVESQSWSEPTLRHQPVLIQSIGIDLGEY